MKNTLFLLSILIALLLVIPASAQESQESQVGEWTQIAVDGVCLYGADYSFFVRPSEEPSDNLLIYFQGGGACWDGLTCGSIGEFASFYEVDDDLMDWYQTGLFELDNPDNPIADYTIVFVPYCSGDVHTGSNDVTFDVPDSVEADFDQIEVFFNGYANTQQVLAWVYANVPQPEQIVVTGCSAGGYGAVSHAPYIMDYYSGIPAVMIADSSHGVLSDGWEGLTNWNSISNLPEFIPSLAAVNPIDYDTTLHVIESASHFPENRFAQFNSYVDGVQVGFYAAAQGLELNFENEAVALAAQWSAALLSNTRRLTALDNYSHYTAGGFEHCVVNNDGFYEFDQSGVQFSQWFGDVITGSAKDVSCSVLDGSCFVSPAEDNE